MLGFAAWWPCFCETLPSRCNMSVQRGAVHRVWTTIGIANGSSKTTGRCTVTDRQLACGWKLKRGTKTASLKRYADGRPQSREMVQTHQRHVCVFCRSLHGPFVSECLKSPREPIPIRTPDSPVVFFPHGFNTNDSSVWTKVAIVVMVQSNSDLVVSSRPLINFPRRFQYLFKPFRSITKG